VYPAVTAAFAGLNLYTRRRYPATAPWTKERTVTTALILFAIVPVFGLLMWTMPRPVPWTVPVRGLVIVASLPFTFVDLVRAERQHGTDTAT
jgi:hypothetical protein